MADDHIIKQTKLSYSDLRAATVVLHRTYRRIVEYTQGSSDANYNVRMSKKAQEVFRNYLIEAREKINVQLTAMIDLLSE